MIEIIKNNYKPLFPKIVVCSVCGSVLKVKDSFEIIKGKEGEILSKCPCCFSIDVPFKEISRIKNGVFDEEPVESHTSTYSDKENMLEKD